MNPADPGPIAAWLPLLAIWVLWAAVCAWNVHFMLRRLRRPAASSTVGAWAPAAVVLAPVKGLGEGYEGRFERLLRQEYPDYRISFAVESREDPAFAFLCERLALDPGDRPRVSVDAAMSAALRKRATPGLRSVEIVVAGLSEGEGQKVHNLRAALEGLGPSDRIVAFVDADAEVEPDWLRRLVEPLHDPAVGVATGYRWLIPEDEGWASILGSAMNAAVATTLGPRWRNSSWAGSMALTREVYDTLDLREVWRGAVNDDTLLAREVRRRGLDVAFAEGLLLKTPVRFTFPGLVTFARRQYVQVRICRPDMWLGAVIITGYLLGWAASIALYLDTGSAWPLAAAAAVVILDFSRARAREAVVRELYGDRVTQGLRRVFTLERWGTPLVSAIHAAIVWSAAFGREIEWAGVRYAILGPRATRVLSRTP